VVPNPDADTHVAFPDLPQEDEQKQDWVWRVWVNTGFKIVERDIPCEGNTIHYRDKSDADSFSISITGSTPRRLLIFVPRENLLFVERIDLVAEKTARYRQLHSRP
jgi:hypothetical protein